MNYLALVLSLAILFVVTSTKATLSHRLLRRQSSEELEQESTTSSSNSVLQQQTQPSRLYPDLPRPPTVAFVPPFGNHNNPNANNGPRPFGIQMPNARLLEPPSGPPRHMSPMERLQSQTFTSGLGRRLLSMIGINSAGNNETATKEASSTSDSTPGNSNMDETMMALQNTTVLKQLNSGVQSIYGSLSRMYNSTVQQQLALLQERYKKEAANSTDPWQQRMAQQVPQFFRSMAMKVNEAQENLNRVWRQVAQAGNITKGTNSATDGADGRAQNMNTRSSNSFDTMMNGNAPLLDGDVFPSGGGFLNHLSRSFGFGTDPLDDPLNQRQDFGSKMMDFWHNQIQPQMMMVRGMARRVWRDLTSSGALRPPGSAMGGRGRGDMASTNVSTDVVDDILKDVEINEPEFKLVESRVGNEPGQSTGGPPMIMPQLQNGIVNMQRELNQLWNGLTNSIQNAMNMMSNRRPNSIDYNYSNNSHTEMDPAENEINDKLRDLSWIQRDADVVYDTVQRQQQARQKLKFTDRFRNFFSNMDLGNSMDQLGNRFGESVTRFGNMMGEIWN